MFSVKIIKIVVNVNQDIILIQVILNANNVHMEIVKNVMLVIVLNARMDTI